MPVPNSLAARSDAFAEWRRDLHRHPELAFEERRTAAFVADQLRAFGCDAVVEGVGGTGVVGLVHGRGGEGRGEAVAADRAILLRADMDALPMAEVNAFAHASSHPGAMHACGHDGHTTMLLAAAQRLAETRAFDGTAVLCFQPAEEKGAGADKMIRDGLLDRFPCREAYALHSDPGLPVGAFSLSPGPVLAGAQDFVITLAGKGGHAAHPDLASDMLLATGHLLTALQSVVARRIAPTDTAVLSITSIRGGDAFNVLPDAVRLLGTVRTYDAAVEARAIESIREICAGVGAAFGAEVSIAFEPDAYPATINDPKATDFARATAAEIVGDENVRVAQPEMGSEDFSFLLQRMPGAFVLIGNGDSQPLHHPEYDFDDRATPYGAAFFVRLVERALPTA